MLTINSASADMAAAADYAAFIDTIIDSSPVAAASLYRIFPDDLARANAVIAVARDTDNEIAAAVHGVIDTGGVGHVNGLAKRRGVDGARARQVVAAVIAALADRGVAAWQADCRVYAPGFAMRAIGKDLQENNASRALFTEFAFVDGGVATLPITGAQRDQHLSASAEPDGRSFRTRYVHSTAPTLGLANACLAALVRRECA
jgi:hypothetical protein